jgi:hypothetical protein
MPEFWAELGGLTEFFAGKQKAGDPVGARLKRQTEISKGVTA